MLQDLVVVSALLLAVPSDHHRPHLRSAATTAQELLPPAGRELRHVRGRPQQ